MGNARWDNTDWTSHASATSSKSRAAIFTQSGIHPDLDPSKFKKRECVESDANPNPTPIIIGADETGSMGALAEQIIKHDLGLIMKEIYDRKPVADPQILCMALGDATCDRAPIQCTQFESSIVLAEQMKNFYLEGNGGGNGGESYPLAWFFAAYKTRCDSIKKRKGRGFLFTIGDECPLKNISRDAIKRFLNMDAECDMDARVLLDAVQKDWHVFHLIVKPVDSQPVVSTWREWLGERAIVVEDTSRLAELIVSIIQLVKGADADEVVDSWSEPTRITIRSAVKQLTHSK